MHQNPEPVTSTGSTQFFAPSAPPGYVWLVRFRNRVLGQAPARVRPVRVTGGLAMWSPGGTLRLLPYAPASAPIAGIGYGFDATPRLVAYRTGCSWQITAADAPRDANNSYLACAMLRILNVVTGRLASFAAPLGTVGWVPPGFGDTNAISPADQMIAAYAATQPRGDGWVRLYVLRLTGPRSQAIAVPSSAALLSAGTAWTAKESWLLYQGHGVAYGPTR
jgi:hypothetical protein